MSDLKGVGKNLRDHGAVFLHFTVNNPNTTLLPRVDEKDMEEEFRKFHEIKRTGFMAENNAGQSFIVSSRAEADGERNWPDYQVAIVQEPAIDKHSPQTVILQAFLCRMKSSGEIGFNTTAYLNGDRNDLKLALIDSRIFSDPSDVQVLIEGGL